MRRCLIACAALALAGCASVEPAPEHPPQAVPLAPLATAHRPTIAFALGGGAVRGFAHAGALKVLDDAGIRADLVVGTSVGSIFGALYAGGVRNDALLQAARDVQRGQLIEFVFPNRGFVDGARLQSFMNERLGGRRIEQLGTPFAAVATELRTGRSVVFSRGDTGLAVRASCSLPAVFRPAVIEGTEYVDGGLTHPVPVSVARAAGADVVIAVVVSRQPGDTGDLGSTRELLNQTIVIMQHSIEEMELPGADVVIRPDVSQVPVSDFDARMRAIEAGEAAARAALPAIRRAIEAKRARR
ncbi:MAG TPA: patatin-like phospholipase family protein [Burkholderiales bacterium]|nr:patatin-like phospholipase family protein [Burkholderiales bacterium]